MLLKATPTTVTTLGLVGDINMADIDLQVVTVIQLQEVIDILTANRTSLENRLNIIGITKIKIPLIEKFRGEKSKLKKLFT